MKIPSICKKNYKQNKNKHDNHKIKKSKSNHLKTSVTVSLFFVTTHSSNPQALATSFLKYLSPKELTLTVLEPPS